MAFSAHHSFAPKPGLFLRHCLASLGPLTPRKGAAVRADTTALRGSSSSLQCSEFIPFSVFFFTAASSNWVSSKTILWVLLLDLQRIPCGKLQFRAWRSSHLLSLNTPVQLVVAAHTQRAFTFLLPSHRGPILCAWRVEAMVSMLNLYAV